MDTKKLDELINSVISNLKEKADNKEKPFLGEVRELENLVALKIKIEEHESRQDMYVPLKEKIKEL